MRDCHGLLPVWTSPLSRIMKQKLLWTKDLEYTVNALTTWRYVEQRVAVSALSPHTMQIIFYQRTRSSKKSILARCLNDFKTKSQLHDIVVYAN